MKMNLWVGIVAVVLSCSVGAVAQGEAAKEVQGTVQELGFGKFKLQEKSGTGWLFYLSKDGSTFKPDDWRPSVGDEISVAHMEVQRRGNAISQVTSVNLIKAGPNTIKLTSPVEVEITEVGRSGFMAKVMPSGKVVRFATQRSTKVTPTGWVPSPGEKAVMSFTAKPASGIGMAFSGPSGMTYALDKVEKVDPVAKSK